MFNAAQARQNNWDYIERNWHISELIEEASQDGKTSIEISRTDMSDEDVDLIVKECENDENGYEVSVPDYSGVIRIMW